MINEQKNTSTITIIVLVHFFNKEDKFWGEQIEVKEEAHLPR